MSIPKPITTRPRVRHLGFVQTAGKSVFALNLSLKLYQNSTLDIHHNSVLAGVTAKILQTDSSLVEDSCEGSQCMDSEVLELIGIMVTALYKQNSWSSSSLSPAHKFTSFCGPSPYKQMCNLNSKSESSTKASF